MGEMTKRMQMVVRPGIPPVHCVSAFGAVAVIAANRWYPVQLSKNSILVIVAHIATSAGAAWHKRAWIAMALNAPCQLHGAKALIEKVGGIVEQKKQLPELALYPGAGGNKLIKVEGARQGCVIPVGLAIAVAITKTVNREGLNVVHEIGRCKKVWWWIVVVKVF